MSTNALHEIPGMKASIPQLPLKYIVFLIVLLNGLTLSSCKSRKILTDSSSGRNIRTSGNLAERYAMILGVSKNNLRNESLYRFIDSWMGVPHLSGGMTRNGIDCSGFTSILQKEIYQQPVARVARKMAEDVKRKYEEELREGDLVFFDFNGQKFSHVGVYLQNNKFVHSSTTKGVIISDLKDPWYYKYFSRAGSVEAVK